jgi:enoyl-CoA hydratase/carnithine racemase
MPPVDLGLSFPGIGTLPRLKCTPQVARKMLLEAHRWTAEEALKDGIVDAIAKPADMLEKAFEIADKWRGKAKAGVYGVLRDELWGEASRAFRDLSYVHRKPTAVAKSKM